MLLFRAIFGPLLLNWYLDDNDFDNLREISEYVFCQKVRKDQSATGNHVCSVVNVLTWQEPDLNQGSFRWWFLPS